MTTPVRRPALPATRVATALAACALALAPYAAQAQPRPEPQPRPQPQAQARPGATHAEETPWKLSLRLSGPESTDFYDVAATGRKDAWAVGRTLDASQVWAPSAKHWDGRTWSDVPLAGTGGRPAQLEAVAASGPRDVWAAGTYTDVEVAAAQGAREAGRLPDSLLDRLPDTLANRLREGAASPDATSPIVLQHWDGTRWKPVSRPAPAEGSIRFVLNMKSLGANSVWLTTLDWNPTATDPAQAYAGHLEHWNGRTWSRTVLPQGPDGGPVEPSSIAGTGPDDVWVSAHSEKDGVAKPLLHHFDGRRWTVRAVPAPYAYDPGWVANHVVSTRRGTVHVLGKTNDPQVPSGLLSARWDGRTWKQLPAPAVDEVNAAGVDASGNVWVAGWLPGGSAHTVLSRWDGTAWTDEELPAELTTTSWGSTVFEIEGVPGTRAVLAAGTAGCESVMESCGLVVSRGLH
ncbi:hypothetical protein [Streptomyces scabiei]|uniref:hypothetical protein n=1 Tax=Streptomyces scabiei TaxID=1930 RepID=UPI0029BB862D|nr:hypothetical protein [Streptomyces scabiei]MDX3522863.1 hypothetical protein [Streptomyces scabiei]